MKKEQRFLPPIQIQPLSILIFFLGKSSFIDHIFNPLLDQDRLIMNPLDIQQQLADQRRGRYVRVSDVDRRLLIDTYKKGEDFIALAKKLNIKRSTGK